MKPHFNLFRASCRSGSLLCAAALSTSAVSIAPASAVAANPVSIYASGMAAQSFKEVPATADSFVDMLGVNVHLHYTNSPYATNYPGIKSLLVRLGARHIRDGAINSSWQPYYDRLNDLGASGIRPMLTTDRSQTAAQLLSVASHVSQSIEAFEGPNEQDLNYKTDSQWPQKAQAFAKLLYGTVKGNAATRHIAVVGPSLSGLAANQAVGNLSAYMDVGNYHEYWPGFYPGIPGWGSVSSYGTYGSIQWNINIEKVVSGSRPQFNTETGYNTGFSARGNVPLDVQVKYVPRILLESYLHNVSRAYIFELIDNTTSSSTVNSFQYGLASSSLTPKPAFSALANLTALLSDRGSSFARTSLSYALAGGGANLHHLLFQKRDGSYYLVMWIEAAGWQPVNSSTGGGRYITIAPQSISVSLPRAARGFTYTTWNAAGGTTSRTLHSGSNAGVTVTDNVSVLKITP